jgi:hypothetical protein
MSAVQSGCGPCRRRTRRGLPCYEVEPPLVLVCPCRHLRMAESKSGKPACDVNVRSENPMESRLNQINGIV